MIRKMAVTIILWLCDRFDVWPVDETRLAMGSDKQARSQRWHEFAREEGGLFDMLDNVRSEYIAAMGKTSPGDHAKLEALAIGAHVAERLRAEVRSVIASGEIEAVNEDRKARMSVTPVRKSI